MSRRNRPADAGVNLDSLMDAMTNVVAVLILVLLLVQVDVSNMVQQFLDELKPATPEDVAEAQARVDLLIKKRDNRLSILKTAAPDPAILEEEKQRLAMLQQQLETAKARTSERNKALEQAARLRKERDALQARVATQEKQVAQLGKQLEATPIKVARPDIVSVPASRPIPEGANVFYCYVIHNRLHLIDPVTPLRRFEREFKINKTKIKHERIEQRGADRYRHDTRAVLTHFKNFNWGPTQPGQKVTLESTPYWSRLHIRTTLDLDKGGVSASQLESKDSPFHQALLALSRQPGSVLMFRVHTDSFETYLKARDIADIAKVPAGWEVYWARHHQFPIMSMEVKPYGEAPVDPNAKPKPPSPPTLKPTLD